MLNLGLNIPQFLNPSEKILNTQFFVLNLRLSV